MQIGIIFPTYEIGTDPGAIRTFAQAAAALGYDHIVAYEHIVGAGLSRNEQRDGVVYGEYAYSRNPFHEPFVLFGYLAALTSLELVTAVLILPQRQTVLVAKQAAEIDLLTNGKLRLGIGTGWNIAKYEALDVSYVARGRLFDEQIAVLRQLWSASFSSFAGQFHQFNDVGLNPLPIQRPIPLWFGGSSDVALRRLARLGDGWLPLGQPTAQMQERVERLHTYLTEAGRAPHTIGIEARVNARDGDRDEWVRQTEAWHTLGATHISLNTLGAGLSSIEQHIEVMRRYKEAITES